MEGPLNGALQSILLNGSFALNGSFLIVSTNNFLDGESACCSAWYHVLPLCHLEPRLLNRICLVVQVHLSADKKYLHKADIDFF